MLELQVGSVLLVTDNRNVSTYFRLQFGQKLPLMLLPSPLKALAYLRAHHDADTIYIDYAAYEEAVLVRARNVLRHHHPELNLIFVARTPAQVKGALRIGDYYHVIPEHVTA